MQKLSAENSSDVDSLLIPRGNTQKNVNKTILQYLISIFNPAVPLRVLDIPCGALEWLHLFGQVFPKATLVGSDILANASLKNVDFQQADANDPFDFGGNFDLVTSISGIMVFGNPQSFFKSACHQLTPGGIIVITNDNSFTVRDRLSFLFTGRVRRFKLLPEKNEGNTQQIAIQEVCRQLSNQGVEIKRIMYTSLYTEDWLFSPLALVLFPLQWLYIRCSKSSVPGHLRRQMFPFQALLSRHYVVVGQKRAKP